MIILKQDFVGLVVYFHYNYFTGRWIRPAFDLLLGHADAVLDNIDEDDVFRPKRNARMFGKLEITQITHFRTFSNLKFTIVEMDLYALKPETGAEITTIFTDQH